MLWNKQDPSVSEDAIRAIGWIVVRTPEGDKICPERAMMSTAHLSFWDVKWAVTERGPALVCGDTTLGYLNDKQYTPDAVRYAQSVHNVANMEDIRAEPQMLKNARAALRLMQTERPEEYQKLFKTVMRGKSPTSRAHNVVRMLQELGGDTPMGARLDPITPAMQLVKDMALRNEETFASFMLWADRVESTFVLIQTVEQAMSGIKNGARLTSIEGAGAFIHRRTRGDGEVVFLLSVPKANVWKPFKTAREAAEIIEWWGRAPKAQPVSDAIDIQDPCGRGLDVDRARGLLAAALRLQSALRRYMLTSCFEGKDSEDYARSIADQANAEFDGWLNRSPSVAPPPQPEPPAPER